MANKLYLNPEPLLRPLLATGHFKSPKSPILDYGWCSVFSLLIITQYFRYSLLFLLLYPLLVSYGAIRSCFLEIIIIHADKPMVSGLSEDPCW